MYPKPVAALLAVLICTAIVTAQQQPEQEYVNARGEAPAAIRVLVAPAEAVDHRPQQEWIGRSIERNLTAELARLPGVEPLTPAQPLQPAPLAELLEAARELNAHYLIATEYHAMEPELRVTGQVVEVQSGRIVGGLQGTGTIRGLFAMQDELVAQARQALPRVPVVRPDLDEPIYLEHPPRVVPSGPVRLGYPGLQYAGSDLQRAVERNHIDRYYYQAPTYQPYLHPYPYGFYGYVPYHPIRVRFIRIHRPVKIIDHQVRFDPTRGHGHVAGFMPMTVQRPLSHIPQPPPMTPELPNPPVPLP